MSKRITHEVDQEITVLFEQSHSGDARALDSVVQKLYPELKRLAGIHSSSNTPMTLSATDVLHSAFIKISKQQSAYINKNHFLAVASKAMRQIIIDYARRKAAIKQGGQLQRVEFDEQQLSGAQDSLELLMINQQLEKLESINPKSASVFECKYFGGMTDSETGGALDIPIRTVQREWQKAKLFMVAVLDQ